jgi:hypothetical protein
MTEYQDYGLSDVTLPMYVSAKVSEKSAASICRVEKLAHPPEIAMIIYQTIWHHSQTIVIFKILTDTVADKLITN